MTTATYCFLIAIVSASLVLAWDCRRRIVRHEQNMRELLRSAHALPKIAEARMAHVDELSALMAALAQRVDRVEEFAAVTGRRVARLQEDLAAVISAART